MPENPPAGSRDVTSPEHRNLRGESPSAPTGNNGGQNCGATPDRILDAALGCFAERGYAGTTLRDVATEVGIRIPSLYNHFPSKAELYKSVLARAIGSIQEVLDRIASGELKNDSRNVIGPLMEVLRAEPNVPKLIQYELLSGGHQLALVLEDSVQPALWTGAAALEEVSTTSRWKPDERPLLLIAFYNLLIGHFTSAPLFRVLTGQDPDAPESVQRQTDFFRALVSVLIEASPAPDPAPTPSPEHGVDSANAAPPELNDPKE